MPEGDTVCRTAQRLERGALRRQPDPDRLPGPAVSPPSTSPAARSIETVSRGKHLLTRIDAQTARTLHTHLKMEGTWQVFRPGRAVARPDHQARVVLEHGARHGGRLPARRRRAARRASGSTTSSVTSAPTCSARTGTRTRRVRRLTRRPGPPARRGAARPAQPGRHRHVYAHRALLPHRLRPAHAGRRRPRPAAAGAARAADARPEPQPPQICTTGDKRRGHSLGLCDQQDQPERGQHGRAKNC